MPKRGIIVTVISAISLHSQNGNSEALAFRSNMLTPVLNRPVEPVDVYSPLVLGFLNSIPAVDPEHLSRKQRLMKTWQENGRLVKRDLAAVLLTFTQDQPAVTR